MEHSKESEAVYVAHEDSHVVMSEKVQALAGSIYQEFERMINKYDEEVVKDLMPLVVNVLECLDLSYTENQEHEVEVELLREDNEQLVTQYEREKQLRKNAEQKLLEIEDQTEEEIKDLTSKIESLEAITRMFELKAKNSADHVSRLEDKEGEMKREYAKLHDRYTELFKTHIDYMERTKILMGTDRLENFGMPATKRMNNVMTRSAGPVSFGYTSLENNSMLKSLASPNEGINSSVVSPTGMRNSTSVNIQEEMTMDDITDSQPEQVQNGSRVSDTPNINQSQQGKSQTKKEERTGNTLYQEFSFQDPEITEEATDITGSWVHPGEYASSDVGSENSCDSPTTHSSVNGMGKEVENLIMENNELLATKNALNIVKDDLIAKVDELTSEHEILREEIASLQAVKSRMKLRIQELEDEIKRTKEEAEKKSNNKSDDEEDVPLAQRKRFTRVEMARVLMERNQYKERFMELQDAVRWTEMLRAAKQDPSVEKRNNRGILNFFSNLFSKNTSTVALTTDRSAEKLQLRRIGEHQQRRDPGAYKQIKAHVRKDDGRMQAYGWSLPAKSAGNAPVVQLPAAGSSKDSSSMLSNSQGSTPGKHLPVPVPIYCRPFMEQSPGMKIFCASGVDLTGGRSKERETSRSYTSPNVWICTATHSASRVTVIDANRPADVLQSFDVCSSHLLCIACIPGAKEDDLPREEGLENISSEAADPDTDQFGRLIFVPSEECDANPLSIDPSLLQELSMEMKTELKTEIGEEAKDPDDIIAGEEIVELSIPNEREQDVGSSSAAAARPVEVKMSSVLSTIWLAAQSGYIYIHSAVAQWEKCLHKVRLPDSVLSIAHLRGRTFVSMANGTVAIFRRGSDGQWDVSGYHLLDLGQQPHHSIRCLSVVHQDVWCGFRNKIHVLDVYALLVKKTFEAHPRKESQVRQMAWCGDGVWVSIRLDSTLRLYHAETYEHLQDVDIEPYVSKMLGTGKLGFSYARITALLVASHRLWIGTGNGVIISVPLSESTAIPNPVSIGGKSPGTVVRVSGSNESGNEIPFCSMSQAQLSFHGHRDAVKFFVAVPGSNALNLAVEGEDLPKSNSMLVISGGEGYIDFRVVDDADGDTASHLIVWKLPQSFHTQNSLLESAVLQPHASTESPPFSESEHMGFIPETTATKENLPLTSPTLPSSDSTMTLSEFPRLCPTPTNED
ncbi:unnamed protein product [Allacma fusca]|uniref:JNK-interacting protein 3 n=1 Tax=Allacma fusca TaxID=39272 RepID=A0A8J2NVR8_9HEXA|nr:unnamed protein product [Allacma fusca]